MSRWSYLITRIIILGLIVCALCISFDPLVRRVLIASAENSLGTQIEIGQVRTSLSKGKVYLKDLRIIDPNDPAKNLLQADLAHLDINLHHLMNRQLVIDQASASKLVFLAPRTDQTEFSEGQSKADEIEESAQQQLAYSVNRLGVHWLDQFAFQANPTGNSQLNTRASAIRNRWKEKIELTSNQIFTLQNQLKHVTTNLDDKNPNPLRVKVAAADEKVKAITDKIDALTAELTNLQKQRVNDRRDILEAANYDTTQIPTGSRFATKMDEQLISQLLLTKSNSQHTDEIIEWFRWFRDVVPDPDSDFVPAKLRGENIQFASQSKRPEFLIKNLDMAGEGHFAGNHFNFSGTAHNITTQPTRHDLPTTFNLRALKAQGQSHVVVDCTLDRRAEEWLDTLTIHCPSLEIEPQELGEPNSVFVSMAPSRVETSISLTAFGDQLSGEIVYNYSGVQLHVDELNELAGGKETALRLNSNLSSINSFRSVAKISGTPDKPILSVSSDLGPRFTAVLQNVITTQQKKTQQFAADQIDAAKQAELRWLDGEVLLQLNHMSDQLKMETDSVARLNKALKETEKIRKFR